MDSPSSSDYDHMDASSFELNIDKAEINYIKSEQQPAQTNINIKKILKEVNERIMNGYRAGFHDGATSSNDNLYNVGFKDGWTIGFGVGLSLGMILSGSFMAIRLIQKN